MAYKFQVGDAIMSGALAQEGDVDLLDSGELKIDATTVITSGRAVQNALTISGSSTLSGLDLVLAPGKTIGVAGDLDLITLNKDVGIAVAGLVSGTTGGFLTLTSKGLNAQAGGISNAGAVAGVTTLDATGLASLDGGINVIDKFTVSTAGAIAVDTNKFTVSAAGAVVAASSISGTTGGFLAITCEGVNAQAGGISNAGAIAGATTVDASGKITGNEFATDGDEFQVSTAGQVTAVGVVAGGAVSAATTVSGSGLFSAAGGLNAGSSRFTVSATGVVSGSVIDGTILAGTELVSQGTLSASLATNIGGMLTTTGDVKFLDIGTDANYARATDGLYYYDATDGELKVSTNDAFLTAIAGAGLSVVGNQLASEAGSTTPNAFAPGDAVLAEGFNYSTGSADSFTAFLPSVTFAANAGDTVKIKAGPLAAGKAITIKPSAATPLMTLDGGTEVLLESPYAAITCVLAKSGSWLIL